MVVLVVVALYPAGFGIGVYTAIVANANWQLPIIRAKLGFSRTKVGIILAHSIATCWAVTINSLAVGVGMSNQICHTFEVAVGIHRHL